jgi:hypothetical protein
MKTTEPTLETSVLFLVFNRLDTTKRVFAEIRKARPKQLFIASDGPRKNKPGEKEIVEKVRKYVLDNIDWKCELKTLFRKKNLGCKYAVSGAIDWFFENVEQGIILEDDCLPSQRFFKFCEELLEKYGDDERIMSISGYNPLGKFEIGESYLFSKYPRIWGWATWRRAWIMEDLKLKDCQDIKKKGNLEKYFPFLLGRILWERRAKQVLSGDVNSWAYPSTIVHRINKKYCIAPR